MVRAARRGLTVVEVPGAYIRREDKTSTVRGLRDSLRLLPRAPALPPPPAGRGRVKALDEIGWARAARFGFYTLAMVPYRLALVPQLRAPWLRLLGARIGRRTILHDVRFFNLYRRGPRRPRRSGTSASSGDECLLDLAEGVRLERQVTLAERVLVLTHTNVGYATTRCRPHFPPWPRRS